MIRRFGVLLVLLAVVGTACSKPTEEQVLDGRAPEAEAVADLARERARLGAVWLTTAMRESGAWFYQYYPITDEYEDDVYNIVRHAGTLYSMWQAVDMFDDPAFQRTAEQAVGYIEDNLVDMRTGKGFASDDTVSLGGQALAIVALLERRRALNDESKDGLIVAMTDFMLSMERPQKNGRYYQSFDASSGEPIEGPDSIYYPGEALLALTRMAAQIDKAKYLPHAVRLADYLTKVRDGDIAQSKQIPRQDHWLTISLNELYRMEPDPAYKAVAYLEADDMIANQIKNSRYPDRIGGMEGKTFSFTSIATKGEAIVAAWALAKHAKDEQNEQTYERAALRLAQFQMRAQYTRENAQLFPQPGRMIGAWGETRARAYIRIDFVQHNISSLMGVWWVVRQGDVPTAA